MFTVDYDLTVFADVTDEGILSKITDEVKNNDGADADDRGPLKSLLSSQEDLQSSKSLQAFFPKPFIDNWR